MSKSKNIEKDLFSLNLQKKIKKLFWEILLKLFENREFLNIKNDNYLNWRFSKNFTKIPQNLFLNFFWRFELYRSFSMLADFVINFGFKNNWVIAIWKFRLCITFQQFSTYIWQTATKLKFSNGYNSVIFKVKIYDKISRHWELPREFKNAKKFQKKILEDFLKNIWKSAIFKNIFFQL